MAWTTPRTWVAGERVTDTLLNLHVRDNLYYLYANGSGTLRGFNAYNNNATFSLGSGAWTKHTLNAEYWDTDSEFDSTTNYRFTVASGGAGKWRVGGTTHFDGGSNNQLAIRKNGTAIQYAAQGLMGSTASSPMIYVEVDLVVSDYLELWYYQDRGISVNGYAAYNQFFGYRVGA